ncbi:MAG: ribbon-helix-helix domain-containing protein [Leptospiraceae bacterium]|nr:ribbon-helix-helix domain-containing protein [Leptospiraceae bacterium]
MPKKIVSFALSEESIEKIDKTSKALGISRSELIEFLVSKGFQFPEEVMANLNEISKLQEETRKRIVKKG